MFQHNIVVEFLNNNKHLCYEGFTGIALTGTKQAYERSIYRVRMKKNILDICHNQVTYRELTKKEFNLLSSEVKEKIQNDWIIEKGKMQNVCN